MRLNRTYGIMVTNIKYWQALATADLPLIRDERQRLALYADLVIIRKILDADPSRVVEWDTDELKPEGRSING